MDLNFASIQGDNVPSCASQQKLPIGVLHFTRRPDSRTPCKLLEWELLRRVLVIVANCRSKSTLNQTWHAREGYKPSVPWLRARERYRLRNSFTGLALIGFIAGVCKDSLIVVN
jgi:hypothetical protein